MSRWPMVPLNVVARQVERKVSPEPGKSYRQIGVKLWGQGAYERETIDGGETRYTALSAVKEGEIIINKIWARNGSVAVVRRELEGCYGSNEFPTFAVDRTQLEPRWVHWLTKTAFFWEQCDEKSRGTSGKNRIRPDKFLEIIIPLPPLAEQRRLVERIDALAAKIEEAKRLRQHANEQTESLHASGIAALIREAAGSGKYSIGDIAEVRGGIQKSPDRTPDKHPVRYLTVAHVLRNEIRIGDPRFFEVKPEELERWRLQAGDVLIIEGNGSAEQIGRAALFRGEINPCVHQNHVIRLRPDRKLLEPEYLNLYLNSPVGQEEVQSRGRTTSGLRSLSVGRIKEIGVKLPSLETQRRIVQRAEELRRRFTAMEAHQAETATELAALLPAILARAFRGDL